MSILLFIYNIFYSTLNFQRVVSLSLDFATSTLNICIYGNRRIFFTWSAKYWYVCVMYFLWKSTQNFEFDVLWTLIKRSSFNAKPTGCDRTKFYTIRIMVKCIKTGKYTQNIVEYTQNMVKLIIFFTIYLKNWYFNWCRFYHILHIFYHILNIFDHILHEIW